MPAFYNGIFGHKPSRFVGSLEGLYPGSTHYIRHATTGPLCRYSEDLIPLLKVIAGEENTEVLNLDVPVDFSSFKLKVFRYVALFSF